MFHFLASFSFTEWSVDLDLLFGIMADEVIVFSKQMETRKFAQTSLTSDCREGVLFNFVVLEIYS